MRHHPHAPRLPNIPGWWYAHDHLTEGTTKMMWHLRGSFLGVAVLLVASMTSLAAQDQSPDLVARIDSVVEAARQARSIPGVAVAVVRGADTIVLKGYGVADLEHGAPVTANTRFQIASISKQFTAAGVLRLAEQGKLRLEDDLTRFVPDYVTNGRRVTLSELLAHTHGMQDYNRPEVQAEFPLPLTQRRFLELMKDQPFDFPVGERFLYRNTGYYFAAMIIEQLGGRAGATGGGGGPITSKPYGDFLREAFFERLGMAGTLDCRNRPVLEGRAHGYETEKGVVVNAAPLDWSWALGVGSLCSTVGDLVRWTAGLHGGKVLSPEMYARMTTPATLNDGTKTEYGLGLALAPVGGRRAIGHGGGAPGYSTTLVYYPDERLTIAVLTNHSGGNADAIHRAIVAAVFGGLR